MTVDCPECDYSTETEHGLSIHFSSCHNGDLGDYGISPKMTEEQIDATSGYDRPNTKERMIKNNPNDGGHDHGDKVSEALKGCERSEEFKQRVSDTLSGRTLSEEHVENISGENNYLYNVTGEDHPVWKEESDAATFRKSGRWEELRKEIYERDDYTCQHCGDRGGAIHAHHIEPVSEGGPRFDKSNLTTLCKECHYSEHGMFGYSKQTSGENTL